MSHEIDFTTGRAAFAYVGAKGWHGHGQELLAGASLEDWQDAAGMAWHIESGKVMFATPAGMQEMPDRVVLYRSDTHMPLGVVSDSYQPVQPREVLKFFDDIARTNGFELETAGCLFDGRRFYATAKIGPEAYVADPADRIKGRLLLVTSADGTLATEGRFVCTRVVCNNTLTMARAEAGGSRIKVSHRSVFKPGDVRRKLGVEGPSLFESTMDEFRALARAPMTGNDMVRATIQALRPDTYDADGNLAVDAAKLDKITRSAPVMRVAELAISGNGLMGGDMAGMRGTAYGWENALTQFVDHEARATSADNRVNSALFGDGAEIKQRAHTLALAHAGYTPAMATSAAHAAIQADSRAVGTMDGGDLLKGLLARPMARLS
jgi:phage/plasmid-like protein (TIGR03299 family)